MIVCFRSPADLWEPGPKSQSRGPSNISQPASTKAGEQPEAEDEDEAEELEEEEEEESEEAEEEEAEESDESEEEDSESEQEDADGEEQLEANCTEIKWQTIDHPWLTQTVVREFGQSGKMVGTVTKWVPADPEDDSNIALFHVVHDDAPCNCACSWRVCGVNGAWVR